MGTGQLLAWAAVLTALATLVSAVGVLVKLVHELREVKSLAAGNKDELHKVKTLVNGNHDDLLRRLDAALDRVDVAVAERDEARAGLLEQTNSEVGSPTTYDPR